jgi:hypothetical protein
MEFPVFFLNKDLELLDNLVRPLLLLIFSFSAERDLFSIWCYRIIIEYKVKHNQHKILLYWGIFKKIFLQARKASPYYSLVITLSGSVERASKLESWTL